jgi:hypothetical protein
MEDINLPLNKLPVKEQKLWVMLPYPLLKLVYRVSLVQH